MAEPVYFYSRTAEYYELSNFAPFGYEDGGIYWPTVEHYFQAQKFNGPEHAEFRNRIRSARSPKDAKTLGRSRKIPIRNDWDDVKDEVMLYALRKKFASGEARRVLLATELRPLIEASPFDNYWGAGRSGTGKNRLGQLLTQVRAELSSS